MYRRPILCALHVAVDFLKFLKIAVVWGGGLLLGHSAYIISLLNFDSTVFFFGSTVLNFASTVKPETLGQFRGQKSRGPLKMSLEMAHKVIVPPKKN